MGERPSPTFVGLGGLVQRQFQNLGAVYIEMDGFGFDTVDEVDGNLAIFRRDRQATQQDEVCFVCTLFDDNARTKASFFAHPGNDDHAPMDFLAGCGMGEMKTAVYHHLVLCFIIHTKPTLST